MSNSVIFKEMYDCYKMSLCPLLQILFRFIANFNRFKFSPIGAKIFIQSTASVKRFEAKMKKNVSRVNDGQQASSSTQLRAPSSSSAVIGNDPYAMMKKSGSFNVKNGMNPSLFGSIFQKVNTALDANIPTTTTSSVPKTQAENSSKKEFSEHQNTFNQRDSRSKQQTTIEETEEETSSDEEDSMDRIKTLDEFEDFSESDKDDDDYSPNVVIVNKNTSKPSSSQFEQALASGHSNNSNPTNNYPSTSNVSKKETRSNVMNNKKQPSTTFQAPHDTSIHDLEDLEEFSDYEDDHVSHSAHEDDSVVIEEEEVVEPEKSSLIEEEPLHEHHEEEDEEFSDFEAPKEDSFVEEFEDFQDSESEQLDDFNPEEFDDFEDNTTVQPSVTSSNASSKIINIPTQQQQQQRITQPSSNRTTPITDNTKKESKNQDVPSRTSVTSATKELPESSFVADSSAKQESRHSEIPKISPIPVLKKQSSTMDVITQAKTQDVLPQRQQETLIPKKEVSLQKESPKETDIQLNETSTQPKVIITNDKPASPSLPKQADQIFIEIPSSRSVCVGTDSNQKTSTAKSAETTTQTDSSLLRQAPPTSTPPFQNPSNQPSFPQPYMYSPYFVPFNYQYYCPPPVHVFRQPHFADVYSKRFDFSHHPFNSYQSTAHLSKPSEHTSQPKQDSTSSSSHTSCNIKATNSNSQTSFPKETFKPYVPQTKELFQRNEKVDQQYKSLRNSLSSYVDNNNVVKSHVREQHERNSHNIRRELAEIKQLLKSTKEDLSHLLYSSNARPQYIENSNNPACGIPSPFNVNSNNILFSHDEHTGRREGGYTNLEKTFNQCNPYSTRSKDDPIPHPRAQHRQHENSSIVQ